MDSFKPPETLSLQKEIIVKTGEDGFNGSTFI